MEFLEKEEAQKAIEQMNGQKFKGRVVAVDLSMAKHKYEATLQKLVDRKQIALRYVTPSGGQARYPENPNGSIAGIAGICDPTGRVLGLMPHPDRAYLPWHMPAWQRTGMPEQGDGMALFAAMVEVARAES